MIDTQTMQTRPRQAQPTIERMWMIPTLPSERVQPAALLDGTTEIGSAPSCDIHIPVQGVDAHHCSIRVVGSRAELTAHSRMTWLNDGPVRKALLKPGQRLAIGPLEFRLEGRTDPLFPAGAHQPEQMLSAATEPCVPAVPCAAPSHDVTHSEQTTTPSRHSAEADDSLQPTGDPPVIHHPSFTRILEHRRNIVGALQESLDEQARATLQAMKGNETIQRERREELNRLLNELAEEQAVLRRERSDLSQQQSEHRRRLLRLQEDEQHLSTRRAEVEQTIEELEAERREQYERERLFQVRIEETHREEAALREREVELRERQQEWEQREASLVSRTTELTDELEHERTHRQRQQAEWDRSLQSLREALDEKADQLKRLEEEREQRQKELADREEALRGRETELARRSDELVQREAACESERIALQDRERALDQRERTIEQRAEELAQATEDGSAQAEAELEENSRLAERHRDLDEERTRLQADRDELTRKQNDCREDAERLTAQRLELEGDRKLLRQERASLSEERSALQEERRQLDADRSHLDEQRLRWEVRQQEIADVERRVTAQLSQIEQRQRELDTRENSLRQREQEIADQSQGIARAEADDADEQPSSEREQLDRLHQSLAEERTRLDEERSRLEAEQTSLQDVRQTIEADQVEVRTAQEEFQRQIALLESARDELLEEKDGLQKAREQFLRDQEAFAEEKRRFQHDADRVQSLSPQGDAVGSGRPDASDRTAPHASDRDKATSHETAEPGNRWDEGIVDDGAETDAAQTENDVDESSQLRSQLAEMFGMSSDELSAKAQHETPQAAEPVVNVETSAAGVSDETQNNVSDDPQDDIAQETQPPSPVADAQPRADDQEATEAAGPQSDHEESVAAYMEQLLARNRRGSQGTAAVQVTASAPQSPADHAAPPKPDTVAQTVQHDPSPPAPPATAESKASRTRPDTELERAHYDTFRDLANQSARSAVARHNSAALRGRLLVKVIVTAALFVTTVLLMTAELWVGVSYATWGFLAAAATCAGAYEVLKTASQMQSTHVVEAKKANDESEDPVLAFVKKLARVSARLSLNQWKAARENEDTESG